MILSETDSLENEEIRTGTGDLEAAEPGQDAPALNNTETESAEEEILAAPDTAETENTDVPVAELPAENTPEDGEQNTDAVPQDEELENSDAPQTDDVLEVEQYDMRTNVFFALEEADHSEQDVLSEQPQTASQQTAESSADENPGKDKKPEGKLFKRFEKRRDDVLLNEKTQEEAAPVPEMQPDGAETVTSPAEEESSNTGFSAEIKRTLPGEMAESVAEPSEMTEDSAASAAGDDGAPDSETEKTEEEPAAPQTMDERLALLGESVTDDEQLQGRTGVRKFAVLDTFNTLRDMFSDAESRKQTRFLGIPVNFLGIGIVVLFLLDMIALNMASYKIIYLMIERILKSNGVEALRLSGEAFSKMFVGISYVASFLIGGLVVLFMARIAERLIRELSFRESSALITGIVGVLSFVFLIGAIVAAAVSGNLLNIGVYRWAGPFLTYVGGLLFLMLSKISLRIDY